MTGAQRNKNELFIDLLWVPESGLWIAKDIKDDHTALQEFEKKLMDCGKLRHFFFEKSRDKVAQFKITSEFLGYRDRFDYEK